MLALLCELLVIFVSITNRVWLPFSYQYYSYLSIKICMIIFLFHDIARRGLNSINSVRILRFYILSEFIIATCFLWPDYDEWILPICTVALTVITFYQYIHFPTPQTIQLKQWKNDNVRIK